MTDAVDHPFNRREGDPPTLDTLHTRVTALERWMDAFKIEVGDVATEVKANTRLTEDIHGKTEEIFAVFETARNGFRILAAVGNALVRIGTIIARGVKKIGEFAQPIFWLVLLGSALYGVYTSGGVPDWVIKLGKAMG